jgi:hypothetical protein
MIEQNSFFRTSAAVTLISILFGIFRLLNIPFQFYLWEFFIDTKILTVAGIIILFVKRKEVAFSGDQMRFLSFNWQKNIWFFLLPLGVFLIPIAVGIGVGEVTVNKLNNVSTLILATIFDIPAIYIFTLTSVFIEEIIFRGIFFVSFREKSSIRNAQFLSGCLWVAYSFSEIAAIEELHWSTISTLLLYYFMQHLICSSLVVHYSSVWPGYSFRVGMISITPILLSSLSIESDSFFKTNSSFFVAEGIIVSILLIIISLRILSITSNLTKIQENGNFS